MGTPSKNYGEFLESGRSSRLGAGGLEGSRREGKKQSIQGSRASDAELFQMDLAMIMCSFDGTEWIEHCFRTPHVFSPAVIFSLGLFMFDGGAKSCGRPEFFEAGPWLRHRARQRPSKGLASAQGAVLDVEKILLAQLPVVCAITPRLGSARLFPGRSARRGGFGGRFTVFQRAKTRTRARGR